MSQLTFGSLFAGIGGFDLGLERAGMRCKWQVEIDPYAQAVLKKHWPEVRRHDDVTTFPPAGDWEVDLICGGFPCQDISTAGKGAGLSGARSGLWYEFARIIRHIRPRWVIVENVRAFTSRGIDTVLGQMADLGYDAEWHCIPACAVGAPHRRERIWIVAYAQGIGSGSRLCKDDEKCHGHQLGDGSGYVADAIGQPNAMRRDGEAVPSHVAPGGGDIGGGQRNSWQGCEEVSGQGACDVAYASGHGLQGIGEERAVERSSGLRSGTRRDEVERVPRSSADWWATEPSVGRVAHGVPSRVDRLRCLGNAVVPQIVEILGRAIIETDAGVAP